MQFQACVSSMNQPYELAAGMGQPRCVLGTGTVMDETAMSWLQKMLDPQAL
jgi:hypothetical protein